MSKKVFITYNHSDSTNKTAREIAENLKQMGLSVWFDQFDIKPGDSITSAIQDAIQNSLYVIAIVTPKDKQSPWVKKELEIAVQQGKIIIPILAERAKPHDLPEPISDRQAIDVSDNIGNLESVYNTIDSRRSAWDRLREYLVND